MRHEINCTLFPNQRSEDAVFTALVGAIQDYLIYKQNKHILFAKDVSFKQILAELASVCDNADIKLTNTPDNPVLLNKIREAINKYENIKITFVPEPWELSLADAIDQKIKYVLSAEDNEIPLIYSHVLEETINKLTSFEFSEPNNAFLDSCRYNYFSHLSKEYFTKEKNELAELFCNSAVAISKKYAAEDKYWKNETIKKYKTLVSNYKAKLKDEKYIKPAQLLIIELENASPRNIELLTEIKSELARAYTATTMATFYLELEYIELLTKAKLQHGEQHIETAKIMIAAARNYLEVKKENLALDLYLQASKIIMELGEKYKENKKLDSAIYLYSQTSEILSEAAKNYEENKQLDLATTLYLQAIEIMVKTAENHEKNDQIDLAVNLHDKIIKIIIETGKNYKNNQPIDFYKNVAHIYENSVSTNKAWAHINVCDKLANSLFYIKQYEESYNFFQIALKIHEQTNKIDSYSYAKILFNIGNIYFIQEKYKEAEVSFKRSLEIYTKMRGDKNPEVAIIKNSLATTLLHLQEHEQAKVLASIPNANVQNNISGRGQLLSNLYSSHLKQQRQQHGVSGLTHSQGTNNGDDHKEGPPNKKNKY